MKISILALIWKFREDGVFVKEFLVHQWSSWELLKPQSHEVHKAFNNEELSFTIVGYADGVEKVLDQFIFPIAEYTKLFFRNVGLYSPHNRVGYYTFSSKKTIP